ncbi:hypothetical protein TRIUR3_13194 [Triticum urartu]|uniref:FAD-binding domain-containing protein n=1 Tax=Triticum urartu TaxID=4572 RepID=M8AM30_TRIUA|nr:hypothetical protein TRIUR3_13194 [Triticum urartu]
MADRGGKAPAWTSAAAAVDVDAEIPGDNSGDWSDAGVPLCWAQKQALLEVLAEELPPGTIRFSSKLASIATEKAQGSPEIAVLRLDDGTVIRSKVLIGCDGVHSVVSQWLGLSEPASSGRSAVRGLAVYPDGHGLKKELRQFLSEGLRAGMVPISDTDVYWFLVNNTIPAEKEAGTDPAKILREVTDNLGRLMPAEYLDVARHSDSDNLSWAPLLYRAPWAILRGALGDAAHPNLNPPCVSGSSITILAS